MTPWRTVLPVHPAAEEYRLLNDEEKADLAKSIEAHGLLKKAEAWRFKKGPFAGLTMLMDGRNRFNSLEELLRKQGQSIVIERGRRAGQIKSQYLLTRDAPEDDELDPRHYIAAVNDHRRHDVASVRSARASALLLEHPDWSNNRVAALAHVSPNTVAAARKKAEAKGVIRPQAMVAGKDGVMQRREKVSHPREQNKDKAIRALLAQIEALGDEEYDRFWIELEKVHPILDMIPTGVGEPLRLADRIRSMNG